MEYSFPYLGILTSSENSDDNFVKCVGELGLGS